QFAEAFNIETAFVPGISSSIGVPGNAGIPVTHRGISESFWVITGTTKDGKLSKDVYQAAKSNATVVILMGVSHLDEIVKAYKNAGKKNIPVAVIQNGTTIKENTALGNISTIWDEVKELNIQSPAIIVIGEVVKFHKYYELLSNQLNYSLN